MAREHAQVKLSIWEDTDFLALSPAAQHLYFVLMTSETLSYCGVADWRPKRIAKKSATWTAEAVETAGAELARGLFIVVDEDTDEVLLRSWVRHDGLMARERMGVAMAKAWSMVASRTLRGVIVHEACRYHEEEPNLYGWKSERAVDLLTREALDPRAMPSAMPLPMASTTPPGEASTMDPPTPFSLLPSPCSQLLASAPSALSEPKTNIRKIRKYDYSNEFEAAWTLYERKGDKAQAFAEWLKAIDRADEAVIVAAIPAYLASQRDPTFRKDFCRWLAGDLWEASTANGAASAGPLRELVRDPNTQRALDWA